MLERPRHLRRIAELLRQSPVVALLGARQAGKTTLARAVARLRKGRTSYFDLEDPLDLARLQDARLALEPLRGLVVLDEIQRRPDLFPLLRVLADRARAPARFLVLGSATPELLRQSSESLAGRIAFHELGPLTLDEIGPGASDRLWLRGGFPRSFLARSQKDSERWRRDFVRTYLERDVPALGISTPAADLGRMLSMLAHVHGQIWSSADLAGSLAVSAPTVRRWLDLFEATFLVRVLRPFHENLAKRQVKSPKVYLRDSGLLHTLLGLSELRDLERHPKLGASFEGFALEQILAALDADPRECFFWATHQRAELDLLVVRGRQRIGFEIKRSSSPTTTPSMRIALADLRLDRIDVVYPGAHEFPMGDRIRALPLRETFRKLHADRR